LMPFFLGGPILFQKIWVFVHVGGSSTITFSCCTKWPCSWIGDSGIGSLPWRRYSLSLTVSLHANKQQNLTFDWSGHFLVQCSFYILCLTGWWVDPQKGKGFLASSCFHLTEEHYKSVIDSCCQNGQVSWPRDSD
jgi:hypothetical protein